MGSVEDLIVGIAGIISGLKSIGDFVKTKTKPKKYKSTRLETLDGFLELGTKLKASDPKGTKYQINTLEDRIRYIREMIKIGVEKEGPQLKRLLSSYIGANCNREKCPSERDWLGYLDAIYRFARDNVQYSHDIAGIDTYQSPLRTLENGRGDCDDYTILIATCCALEGFKTDARVIRTKGKKDWNHIYVIAYYPPGKNTKKIAMDASVDKSIGWEAPKQIIADKKDFSLWPQKNA